ncbi:MAG: hypothetical protein RSE93_01495 [Oscillospiraceae bacterium]
MYKMMMQYLQTAEVLNQRISQLKKLQEVNRFDLINRYEERIAVLQAERYHLLHIAKHIKENYL